MHHKPMRLLVLVLLFAAEAGRAASNAPVAAKNGMVVTAQEHATRIGVDVLRNGGNAIDAAVAVGYALAVVYPAAGNLGGGGFMTLQLADGRKTFIDFRETAPLAATATMYLDANGNVIPDRSTRGHLAVAVPGTVSGLEYAREKYGTMARARLIAPSITLAERGFVLAQGDVDMLHEATDDFRKDAPRPRSFSIATSRSRPAPRFASATSREPCATSASAAPTVSTKVKPPPRSSPRAARARASSRRRISMRTRRASSRPWNATTAGFTSSPRRRRAPAASCCARC